MTSSKSWAVNVQPHSGSSEQDIANEPDWGAGHQHRVGYRNRGNRVPGLTHEGDYKIEIERARHDRQELKQEVSAGDLINFCDLMEHQHVSHCPRIFSSLTIDVVLT